MVKQLCLYSLVFSYGIVHAADKSPTYEDFKNLRLTLNAIAEQMGDKKDFELDKEWRNLEFGTRINIDGQTETGMFLTIESGRIANIITPFARIFLARGSYDHRHEWWVTLQNITDRIQQRVTLETKSTRNIGGFTMWQGQQCYAITAVDGMTMPAPVIRKENQTLHEIIAKMKSCCGLYRREAVLQHVPISSLAGIIVSYIEQD